NKNYLEIFLLNNNISDFLTQSQYLENLQASLQDNVEKMKLIKTGLEVQKSDLENQKQTLSSLQQDLISQRQSLSLEQGAKNNLLSETQDTEWKFQTLLAGAIQEQKAAEIAINNAEEAMRTKLANQKEALAKLNENGGPLVLSWPVPENTITTGFHDPDYPFIKSLGQHPAIDIRAAYGTPIRAPAAGYVGKVHDGGMGYSYIMLIHRDGVSTVYGHVSAIDVIEGQYVTRGKMIGRSGGIPGTPGAGPFCTGPHLHFEVRLNGIPVNPINYLI
ncbi:MAG: peptidoglycan DD-metalloendopeptidase family protein, partial [Candidatus Parcubacteria bacterium]|nr:peptidoglycan DD-metalloendopeptidase family protein [Candidatus Parcubacteria bacterium]